MNRIEETLRAVYRRLPPEIQPALKRSYDWLHVRRDAVVRRRRVFRTSRIVFLYFDIAHLELHELLGPDAGEVLVESHYSVVSPGTERGILIGLPGTPRRFPFLPGYSAAGVVRAVGPGVRGFAVGDRVAGGIHHAGLENVDASRILPVPEEVTLEEASFVVLGVIVQQGVRKARIEPGERVAVVGQGLLGQLANRLVRMMGPSELIAVARTSRREATSGSRGMVDEFLCLDRGVDLESIGADVVIEVAGTDTSVSTALRCAGKNGRVVIVGSARSPHRGLVWNELAQDRGVSILGAHVSAVPGRDSSPARWTYRQEATLFLELLRRRHIEVEDLVSRRADPRTCNQIYESLVEGNSPDLGIVFTWHPSGAFPTEASTEVRDTWNR